MLDWLRYFPLALRRTYEPTIPKGPYFSKLQPQCWNLADSHFRFSMPRNNAVWGTETHSSDAPNRQPGPEEILQQRWPDENQSSDTKYRWQHAFFSARHWLFVGPWFTGTKARLSFSANVIAQSKPQDFQGSSFFHPRVFELAIADYLNAYYGHKKTGRKPSYRGPLNWKHLQLSDSIQGAQLDIHHIGNTSKENPGLIRLIYFPITHDKIVELKFNFGGTLIVRDPQIAEPLFALADSITDTFSLTLGPQTQTEWNKIKQDCPDMSLCSEFGELQWPIKFEDIGKVQKPTDTYQEGIEQHAKHIDASKP